MTTLRGRGGGRGKRGGGGGRAPQEAPNTLRAKTTAYLVDVLGEGEIVGLVDGARSIYFDDTPLMNPDGSVNFRGVTWVSVVGLPDQHALPGFAFAETEVAVAQRVRNDTPVVRTITTSGISALRVKIRVPALVLTNSSTGDMVGTSVAIAIDIKRDTDPWVEAVNDTISGKCTAPYERAYRVRLPQPGPWQVRVRRLTADNDSNALLQNETWWASYTELRDWQISYADSAYIGLAVDAEVFGSRLPTRSYDVRGLKIKVPSNYNPQTRTYTGQWDGTFQIAWTDNPAWIFYDLLTNERYGLGSSIPAAAVDKWALYTIAQYCDEMVPNGAGGQEPRYTFNGVINDAREAWEAVQTIAAAFRGMVHWGAGLVTATQDSPAEPVKLVTNANVIDGVFSYSGTALSSRHTVAQVTWTDPENGYRPTIELVEDQQALARWGSRPIDIAALGVTSRGLARRLGRWVLDTEATATTTVTYRAALDHAGLRPGDIIAVADQWLAGVRYGGRVAAATITTVTLDAPVTLESGQTYTLRVTLPDGTVAQRPVTTGAGTHTTLTLASALPEVPVPNAVWLLASSAVEPRQFRVISVAEVEPSIYEITALLHDPTKYARIEQNVSATPPGFTAIPTGPVQPPSNVTVREFIALIGGAATSVATVSWALSPDPRVQTYQVEAQLADDPGWRPVGVTATASIDVVDTRPGPATFRVRATDALGRHSAWVALTTSLVGLDAPPDDVTDVRGTVRGDTLRLTWSPVRAHGYATYRVRFSPLTSNAKWTAAVDIATGVTTAEVEVPLMRGSFLIRAELPTGVMSETPAVFVNLAEPLTELNAVASLPQHPDWNGTKTNLTVSNNNLVISAGHTSGTYQFSSPDLTQVYVSRVSASINVTGVRSSDDMLAWPDVFAVENIFADESDEWSAMIELRTTLDDPSDTPTWSEWQPFVVGDYTARAFQFRLTLASLDDGETRPVVSALTVEIDMPDRTEGANNVTVPATGLDVTFNNPFATIPAIVVTGRNLASGDYVSVTNQAKTGFRMQFFNSVGLGVARVADWVAVGYGRQV